MAVIKWIDLSSVGVHLGSYRDANKQAGVALVDTEGQFHEAIVQMGFLPASGPFSKGLYLKADHAITPAMLRTAFGSESVKFFAADQTVINRQFNEKVKEITKVNSNALFSQTRPIGVNSLGEVVQESIIGRYVIRQENDKPVVVKEDGINPALFLRASTKQELRDVTKGFVMRITARKERLRREHITRLIDVSNNGNFSKRDYQEAIEIGLNDLFAEGLANVLSSGQSNDPLDAYDVANEIYVGMPELKERTANSIANQQYSTPVPMAALAQAMLARRADLAGASVLDPTIGNANLVSGLNVGTTVGAGCKVYGAEIDPARVEQIEGTVEQVVLGDATALDFRGTFNKADGFDYVIANPPFGSLDSKQDVHLPAGSAVQMMDTARIDHLIMLNALHARKDSGRAIFITGADSAIDNGEIKGRSKHLLNYLFDHYEIEGIVDVSGELYKKQGAQYPLRMYVIGARKAQPQQTDAPENLTVIRTYEALRDWAGEIIKNQSALKNEVVNGVVPDSVKRAVEFALNKLRDIKRGVEEAKELEKKVGMAGRYQADAYLNREVDIESARSTLTEFREHAPKNGVDAEAFIAELGGEPDLTLSPEAQAWIDDPRGPVIDGKEKTVSATQFGDIDIADVKAAVTTQNHMPDVPAGWIVMNAPRPLLGQMTQAGGDFLHGRFYAAIDPSDGDIAKRFYDRNIRDDAYIVFTADEATLQRMGLVSRPEKYRAAYLNMPEKERAAALQPFVNQLNGKTYGELVELAARAATLVNGDAPAVSRAVALEREANTFGQSFAGYYGVVSDGQDLPVDFMPESDNKQMALEMGDLAKEHGESFAFQIKTDSDKPFRVVKALYENGRGIGSQWAETAAGAYDMLPAAELAGQEPEKIRSINDFRRLLDKYEAEPMLDRTAHWVIETDDRFVFASSNRAGYGFSVRAKEFVGQTAEEAIGGGANGSKIVDAARFVWSENLIPVAVVEEKLEELLNQVDVNNEVGADADDVGNADPKANSNARQKRATRSKGDAEPTPKGKQDKTAGPALEAAQNYRAEPTNPTGELVVQPPFQQEEKEAAAEPKEDTRQESNFQQRYIAFSNVSEPDTMIPANLSGPIYEALSAIKEKHGDIDEYVGRELDYAVGDLGNYFKAEQVDALAMIFHANDRRLGFLLGDKMGVGKGRVLAGVARRERLQGRIPIFVTLKHSLFSDFLERDVVSIGSRGTFVKPLIINDGCKTVDENGDVVVKALPRSEYRRYAENGELPEGTDMIMLTYSQLARRPEKHLTSTYMRQIAQRYPVTIILDESHHGAGASNTSENLAAMIESIGSRGNVIYSSGTAIKGAKNLRLYTRILPKGIDHEELLAAVESDPLSLQEALNYEIAAQGCMISRELDDTGIEKQFVLSEHVERNRAIADQMAEIFSSMAYLSGDVKKIVGRMNAEMRKELEQVPEAEREGSRMGASSMNFGSRLHELNRQFLMALKAVDVVRLAERALEDNKKPIIAIQHTGESILNDFITRANEVYDDNPDRVKKQSNTVIIEKPVTFKDLMHKYLEKISWIKIQGRYGDVSFRQAESKEIILAASRIEKLIDALPDDLPLTPIDFVRERMAVKGFSVGEVSGRNVRASTLEDGRVIIEPVPGRSDKTRINRVVREFNNGDVDVLMLTGSGSTGISAQASPAVGRDVRARLMIKWEMQPDIAAERQMDGRHNRTGQIVLPEYQIPMTGLPADDRLAMMFNNKNRSLTSSTVANRDSKDIIREVPDLLNEVGDLAAGELLFENPLLAERLDIQMPEDADERAAKGPLWYSGKLSGRLSLLRVGEQEKLYADWQNKFTEKLDQLKAEGRNPLEVECLDWKATVVSRDVFMGSTAKADGSKSQFNAPVYLTTIQYEKTLQAVRAEEVDRKIKIMNSDNGLSLGDNTISTICNYLQKHREEILTKHMSKRFPTLEEALQAKEPNEVQNAAKKLDWLAKNLPKLARGAIFADTDLEDKKVPHVILQYNTPSKIEGFARLSDYVVYTMQPGSDLVEMKTLSALFAKDVQFLDTTFQHHAVARKVFDEAENGVVRKQARLFDGNLFEATSLNLRERVGRKIVYTDYTGARQHGILISSSVPVAKLNNIPEKVRDVKLLVGMMQSNTPVTSDEAGDWRKPNFGLLMSLNRNGSYDLSVPMSKSRGGDIFLDPVLSQIAGKEKLNKYNLNFSTNAGKMTACVPSHQINELLTYLTEEKNMSFYVKDRAILKKVREEAENCHESTIGVD